MEDPRSGSLRALGFETYSIDILRNRPEIKLLVEALGVRRQVFIHTQSLGLGYTVTRDECGRLWMGQGQFDLSFMQLIEVTLRQ